MNTVQADPNKADTPAKEPSPNAQELQDLPGVAADVSNTVTGKPKVWRHDVLDLVSVRHEYLRSHVAHFTADFAMCLARAAGQCLHIC